MEYVLAFSDQNAQQIAFVGGKNAALAQMIHQLTQKGIKVPLGFAITAQGYWHYLEHNKLVDKIKNELAQLNPENIVSLQQTGKKIRAIIQSGEFPPDLAAQIKDAYQKLCAQYNQSEVDVAVRSSATAEDLPHASFAGQQETYLNISGVDSLLVATRACFASLFTDRAIIYRIENKFDHMKVALSVGVQKMIRSDKAVSGVMFTMDTDSGFKDSVIISSSYGLGESIVSGRVNPDEFHVFKPTLKQGYRSIIKKYMGSKTTKIIYAQDKQQTVQVDVTLDKQHQFSLTDDEILELARQGLIIEDFYSGLHDRWYPMDIEWAKDGTDQQLYIVQARPETIHGHKTKLDALELYKLKAQNLPALLQGQAIGRKIASGKARVLSSMTDTVTFNPGDILVTTMTDPDWVPLIKKASAVITNQGGRTCHAAIVSREMGIPAIIGTSTATTLLHDGQEITVDCSQGSVGYIYGGIVPFEIQNIPLTEIPIAPVELLVNIADPDRAYELSALPVSGVGLARIEFIISNMIKIHPMAICDMKKITDQKVITAIEELSRGYTCPEEYYIDSLAQGIGMIAAAFYPKKVLVRLSDFKTNEYRNLIGGSYFEAHEENPMLGFRGAVRYCSDRFASGFLLECAAIKKARNEMGLDNIALLVPFVRTVNEAQCTLEELAFHGLERNDNGLKIFMMCEIPSNILLLDEFALFFDGFSIGSNDLTQFTLAVDRDSQELATLFNEDDPAVKKFIEMAINKAQECHTYISICGQGPSDKPDFAQFLIDQGIDALSLNADAIIPFLLAQKATP